METRRLAKQFVDTLPKEALNSAAMCILDSILVSKKGDKMPSSLAKELLYLWKSDQLASEPGLGLLIEAAAAIDLEEAKRSLSNKGFTMIAEKLPSVVTQ